MLMRREIRLTGSHRAPTEKDADTGSVASHIQRIRDSQYTCCETELHEDNARPNPSFPRLCKRVISVL
jgi:hypothetical protein